MRTERFSESRSVLSDSAPRSSLHHSAYEKSAAGESGEAELKAIQTTHRLCKGRFRAFKRCPRQTCAQD